MNDDTISSQMPDEFDRLLGVLDGLPDVTRTRESVITVTPTLGVGGSKKFIVQTVRQTHGGISKDTIFLEVYGAQFNVRVVLPGSVANAIARQRESLSTMTRKKVGRRIASDRKALGLKPGFKMTKEERAEAKRRREKA